MASRRSAQALWYVANGRAELRREPLREPAAGEALVRALYSGVSRGTESLVFAGRVPPSEYGRMRSPQMGGDFPFPVKHGYALVGGVEAGAAELVGKTVFALHPHQSAAVLAVDSVVVVPAGVPARRAVLAANMETALNAVWDAGVLPAMRVAVVGAGVVGCLVARLCARIAGVEVTLVDVNAQRAETAGRLGARFALPASASRDCDVVFHASATADGLATALDAAGDEASVVELSWYGDRTVAASLGGAFHSHRLHLIASQVGAVAPAMRARRSHRDRLTAALALLDDEALDCLLGETIPFAEAPARLPAILSGRSPALCAVLDYAGGSAST